MDPPEALVRLLDYAYAHDRTAVEVARPVVARRLSLGHMDRHDAAGPERPT